LGPIPVRVVPNPRVRQLTRIPYIKPRRTDRITCRTFFKVAPCPPMENPLSIILDVSLARALVPRFRELKHTLLVFFVALPEIFPLYPFEEPLRIRRPFFHISSSPVDRLMPTAPSPPRKFPWLGNELFGFLDTHAQGPSSLLGSPEVDISMIAVFGTDLPPYSGFPKVRCWCH